MFGRRSSKKLRADRNRKNVFRFETLEDRRVMSADGLSNGLTAFEPVVQTSPTLLTTEEWVQSLTYPLFHTLTPAQVIYLTPQQIASIPNTSYFGQWSAASRAALSATQVRSLNVGSITISLLTDQQKGYLTVPQVQSIKHWDLEFLLPSQVPSLLGTQIGALNHGFFAAWQPAARAALTAAQVPYLNMESIGLSLLTTQQQASLTSGQVQDIPFWSLESLITAKVPSVSASQLASLTTPYFDRWTADARAALTPGQVQHLNVAAVSLGYLTPTQISWLSVSQIQSVPVYELFMLNAAQVPSISTSQIAGLSTLSQFLQWTPGARAALTAVQVQALNVGAIGLSLLTPQQVGALTFLQIRTLSHTNFKYLLPSQMPSLAPSQLAAIPSLGFFAELSAAQRAALTMRQVRALHFDVLWLHLLTASQRAWLSVPQMQSLSPIDFARLSQWQTPHLTVQQLAGIPNVAAFAEWSAEARAALTRNQVQALDVTRISLSYLTSYQINWLTTAQIRSLPIYELPLLHADQIPSISLAQFAAMTTPSFIHAMSPAAQANISMEQFLALPPTVWADYSLAIAGPSNYHPAVHMPIGPDGVPISAHMTEEANKFFALVPLSAATHTTIGSGDWTDPRIWSNGIVPGAGAKVVISSGTTVRFNAYMNSAIKTLRIDGALSFAVNENTQLKVDTIVVMTAGKLHIGTAANPIQDHVTARVLIADGGPIDTTWDPAKLSRGLLSRGEVRMYGKDVTPFVSAQIDPMRGDTQLVLSQIPTNWKVGDRIVISGNHPSIADFGAEERQILAIQGNVVTIAPLTHYHNTPVGYGQSIHIANLTRNIQFVAEDPSVVSERPHIVFFHNPNVIVENIGVYGFGRTDKSVRINDPVVINGVLQPGTGSNPRARYAMHFHHTGVNPTQAPAIVRGSLIEGSPGWGFVNHSSNVNFEDNVAYKINGSGFVTEDGNEIGAMRRNLALNITGTGERITDRKDIHDFGFNGHGFWFQGPGIEVVDNIVSGTSSGAFAYFTTSNRNLFDSANLKNPSLAGSSLAVPVEMVPIAKFSGNTAYAVRSGLEIWHHMMKVNGPATVVENFTSWGSRMHGIEVWYSGNVTIRNSTLIGNVAEPTGLGVWTNRFTQSMRFENVRVHGFETGVLLPVLGTSVVNGGDFLAVQALSIAKGHDTQRSVLITGPINFRTLTAAQLAGRKQYDVYMLTSVDLSFIPSGTAPLFTEDRITMSVNGQPAVSLSFYNQLFGYVPLPSSAAGGLGLDAYLDRTNGQLMAQFGKSFGGRLLLQGDGYELPRIYGVVRSGS